MSANTYLLGTPCAPLVLNITAISRANPMVISTSSSDGYTADQLYVIGQLVTLTVPFDYGMTQANELTAQILNVSGSDIAVNVNSLGFDPFVVPVGGEQPATLAPGGSRNTYEYTKLPFHSLTNTGN